VDESTIVHVVAVAVDDDMSMSVVAVDNDVLGADVVAPVGDVVALVAAVGYVDDAVPWRKEDWVGEYYSESSFHKHALGRIRHFHLNCARGEVPFEKVVLKQEGRLRQVPVLVEEAVVPVQEDVVVQNLVVVHSQIHRHHH